MKKELTWQTGDGREVVFTVELRTKNVIGRDDIAGEISKPCCEIDYSATVAGQDVGGTGWLQTLKDHPQGVVAGLGNLGIYQANYDRIMAAKAEIEASDYVQEWNAKEAAAAKLDADYEAHTRRVDAMMKMGESEE